MRKALLLISLILSTIAFVTAANAEYDAIIVRSDLPYDWTVAQAYSQRAKIPIITTYPDAMDQGTRDQLIDFRRGGHNSILVLGGEAAISPGIESELVEQGFITHRIREVDRYGTSARVAVELYGDARVVVMVNGENVDGLLNSQMAALKTGAPILFIKRSEIPQSVKEALRALGTREVILVSSVSDEVALELRSGFEVKTLSEVPREGQGFGTLRVLDIVLGLVLGTLLSLLLRFKRKEKVPYNVLTEDEGRVIKAIKENGGELGQDILYEKTGFSRPKISRIVSELVERDILEKTQFKRTFKLKIKKELTES